MASQVETVRELLKVFETMDSGNAMKYFSADASYRFGNYPPAVGIDQIRQAATSSHMSAIKKAIFDVKEILEFGDVVVCELDISYVRNDDSSVTLPCMDYFRFEHGLIKDMRIYMDANPLFAAHQTA
jgi:limonene-1,2-epoxide hydrolase